MDCPECAQKCGRAWNVCGYLLQVMSTLEQSEARDEYMEELRKKEAAEREKKLDEIWNTITLLPKRGRRGAQLPSLRKEKTKNVQSDRWFITVSVRPDSDIAKLWKRCQKFMGMAKVQYIIANMDQSGAEEYKHPHVHWYVEYPKPLYQSKVIQVFSCAFTDYIGGDNFVDVKLGGEHHIKYCKGVKTDDKAEILELSRRYRQENNIPDYIERCPGSVDTVCANSDAAKAADTDAPDS